MYSAFRMEPDVPLVVPINEEALKNHHGIIANPNCSTIQMVVALEPIRQAFGLNQVLFRLTSSFRSRPISLK